MKQIRIGTLVGAPTAVKVIPQIMKHGFESFGLTFWRTTGDFDFQENAKKIKEILADKDIKIATLGVFGNPLTGTGEDADTLASWERAIDNAHLFGAKIVAGFTGRIPDVPIDESMDKYTEVFGELAKRAESKGIKIAFENCEMNGTWERGTWNIAHNPTAWEMMFNAVPSDHIGLQWEPCHQMTSLIDPIPQLRKWAPKVFNVHGKDATIAWDIVKKHGIHSKEKFVWHRTPGFGDSNWSDIITILRQNNYEGSIEIEGWHDPVYRDELEMTGQVHGLNYLKRARGGDFVPNPEVD